MRNSEEEEEEVKKTFYDETQIFDSEKASSSTKKVESPQVSRVQFAPLSISPCNKRMDGLHLS